MTMGYLSCVDIRPSMDLISYKTYADLRAEAERTFVRALDAGCTTPLGVYCTNEAGRLHLRVQLLSLDGTRELTGEMDGNAERPWEVGRDLAKELLEQGAAEMVAEARGD